MPTATPVARATCPGAPGAIRALRPPGPRRLAWSRPGRAGAAVVHAPGKQGAPVHGAAEPFAHPALFYGDPHAYLAGTVPFVRAGPAAGEPVAVAVPGERLRLIRDALGADGAGVRFLDMREVGRNPGRIIPGVLRAFADARPPGRRVRIIGEPVWAGRGPAEYPACVQDEALINAAFRGREVTILCPYDTAGLDARALADARGHPSGRHRGRRGAGRRGLRPAGRRRPLQRAPAGRPGPRPRGAPRRLRRGPAARRAAPGHGPRQRAGTDRRGAGEPGAGHRRADHQQRAARGGSGTLTVWAEDGRVLCEVRDRGRLTDPLAGRRPVGRDRRGGRGLLLVNLVSDLVRVHTGPDGTTIRCHLGG
ncbi:anti-sigma factor RsbA family regulatory protein [Streptomyces sp. SCPE 10]|uniref:anti-sigma factor RsbA family regulatory protein n=1 Tax=Streptomyces sp. SCPE 10 TaxID=3449273 RepID=UPI003F7F11BD